MTNEPLIEYERALAALADAVEAFIGRNSPKTFDALEAALGAAKRVLEPKGVEQ